jgi:hypothetical protein
MSDGWIILAQGLSYRQDIVGALGRGDDARERMRRVCGCSSIQVVDCGGDPRDRKTSKHAWL